MELKEIDKKIKEFQEKTLNVENFMNLMHLIELKMRIIYNEEDVRHFSSLIKDINFPDDIFKTLTKLRNLAAHNFISNKELQSQEDFIKSIIIPTILTFPEDNLATRAINFEKKSIKKLKLIGKKLRFKVETKKIIKLGISRLELDLIFIKNNIKIIFEIKYGESDRIKELGIQQLIKYLIAYPTQYGVLILPKTIHQIIKEENYEILIFGTELEWEVLENWLNQKINR